MRERKRVWLRCIIVPGCRLRRDYAKLDYRSNAIKTMEELPALFPGVICASEDKWSKQEWDGRWGAETQDDGTKRCGLGSMGECARD